MTDSERSFTCEMCNNTFEKNDDWNDEKAKKEFDKNFPNTPAEEKLANVCDDCYQIVLTGGLD